MIKVAAFGSAFAAIPLFASMENLEPPWPTAIAYVSAAVILVAALVAREYGPGLKPGHRRLMLLVSVALTLAGLFAYLYLYSTFVVVIEDGERFIFGYECNGPTQAIYKSRCPDLGEAELSLAGYEPESLFTKGSLTAVRLALVAAWLVFIAGLMAAVAWAVAARRLPLTGGEEMPGGKFPDEGPSAR